jgi:hypothetical protein
MRYDDDPRRRRRRARKHTGFGIASVVVAAVAGLAELAVFLVAGTTGASNPDGIDMESPLARVLVQGVCGATVGAVAGLGLAVVGLCQTGRKPTFAVLGLVLNGLVVACVVFWMVVGALTG